MAGKPRAEYEIKAKDDTKKGISSAKSGIENFGKASKAAFGAVKVASVAAVAAVTAVSVAAKKLTDAYAAQEKAELGLIAASRNNPMIDGTAVQSLLDTASALQEVSTFGDEALIPFMQLGVNMGYTQEQIEAVSQAAIDLSAATGKSLDSSFNQIYKTLQGTGGELNETVNGMRDLTAEELRAGKGIELLNEQFGGMAQAMAKSTAGVKEQFQNLFGDVLESAGAALAPLSRMTLEKLKGPLEAVGQWFEDNQQAITNFFLNFGEIARLTFEHVKESLQNAFAWENVVKTASALWEYLKTSFQNTAKFFWGIMKAVATTIWLPLKKGFEWVVYGAKVGWQAMINGFATGINWLVENPINAIATAFETIVHAIGEGIEWMLNGVIDGVNGLMLLIDDVKRGLHDLWQSTRHPFDESKRTQYQGTAAQIAEMDIDWLDPAKHQQLTTNLDRFISDVGDIPKPANEWESIYNQIGDVWRETAGDSVDLWLDQFEALKELAGTVAEPFLEGFEGFSVEFKEIISRELPPEAQNLVDTMMAEMQAAMTNTVPDRSWGALMQRIMSGFEDIGDNIANIGKSLWQKTKGFVGNVVEAIKNPGEAIGNLFTRLRDGLAEAGHSFLDKVEDLAENGFSDEFKAKMKEAASFIGGVFATIGKWVLNNLMNTEGVQEMLGKLQDSIAASFESIVGPLLDGLEPVIDALIGIADTSTQLLMPVLEAVANLLIGLVPLLDMLGQFIQMLLTPIMDILVQVLTLVTDLLAQIMPVIEVILEMLITVLTPVLEFISEVLNMLAPVFEMIGDILLSLVPVFEAIGILLSEILGPALQFIAELLQAVLTPVLTIIGQVLTVLTPIFKIFAAIMKAITPIFDVLFQILSLITIPLQILAVILEALNPLFEILAWALEFVIPVIGIFAKIIDAVTRPLEFLGDLAAWLGTALKAFGQALFYAITFQWDKFGDIEWPGAFTSDAFTRPLIDISDMQTTPLTTTDVDNVTDIPVTTTDTTDTSGSVSYGGMDLTVNVTINAEAVVGEPGLREFALMIQDEIEEAKSLGIA